MRRLVAGLTGVLFVSLLFGSGRLFAEEMSTPANWTAPLYWTPPAAAAAPEEAMTRGGIPTKDAQIALAGAPTPLPFVAITPCRIIDTRSVGLTGQWGPPSMPGVHTQRSFDITGQCLIPSDAQAVSFNFSVWAPVTRGDIRVFPKGLPTPTVATLNWEASIQALANAAVVPLGTGAITVQVDGPGTIDLIVDVNGYYSPLGVVNSVNALSGAVSLVAGANTTISQAGQTLTIASPGGPGGVLPLGSGDQTLRSNGTSWEASNILTNTGSAISITAPLGVTNSGSSITGTSTSGYGVYGESSSGYGVLGTSNSALGVYGSSNTYFGVYGVSFAATAAGVWGSSIAGHGVSGTSSGAAKAGVQGINHSANGNGVWGTSTNGRGVMGESTAFDRAGVHGQNDNGQGVFGTSANGVGVSGNSANGVGVSGSSASLYPAIKGENTGPGLGVYGSATSTAGVYGTTSASTSAGVLGDAALSGGHGVVGTASTAFKAGVQGVNNTAGGYGIWGTSTSGYGVYCEGNGGYTGTWSNLSDGRLKRDVETLDRAVERVLALRGVRFNWKTEEAPEKNLSKEPQIGFIAQEVEAVVPEVVVTGPDGYKAIDYAKLAPVLVEALKELQGEIQQLKRERDTSAELIRRLEQRIALSEMKLQEIR